jgi:hypothetical protein
MPSTLGRNEPYAVFEYSENHKLHLEFMATGEIKKGAPVEINADGTVSALPVGGDTDTLIGVALMDAEDEELITVAVRGYAVVNAHTAGALNAGLVEYKGYAPQLEKHVYGTPAYSAALGLNLDQTTTAGDIRVLLFIV